MLRWLLDVLTFGYARKRRELVKRLAQADKMIAHLGNVQPRFVQVRPLSPDNEDYGRYITSILEDQRFQWFLLCYRETLIKQSIDGTRTGAGDRDIYLGALVGLDLMLTDMRRIRAESRELTEHGS